MKLRKIKNFNHFLLLIVNLWLLVVSGCHSGGPDYSPRNVRREDPGKEVVAGYRWNDTDYKLVTDHMYNALLNSTFYKNLGGKKITIMTGTIENRTLEHIDTKVLSDSINTKLIRSGIFNIVDESAREELNKEYEYHKGPNIEPATRKQPQQIGEDYLLRGHIYSNMEESRYLKVIYYKVTLYLTDIQTNIKVWQDEIDIKKVVEK